MLGRGQSFLDDTRAGPLDELCLFESWRRIKTCLELIAR